MRKQLNILPTFMKHNVGNVTQGNAKSIGQLLQCESSSAPRSIRTSDNANLQFVQSCVSMLFSTKEGAISRFVVKVILMSRTPRQILERIVESSMGAMTDFLVHRPLSYERGQYEGGNSFRDGFISDREIDPVISVVAMPTSKTRTGYVFLQTSGLRRSLCTRSTPRFDRPDISVFTREVIGKSRNRFQHSVTKKVASFIAELPDHTCVQLAANPLAV